MSLDWRKAEKSLYLPPKTPTLIEVPAQKLLCVEGQGSPDHPAFKSAIELLFSTSYALKFAPRKGLVIDGYVEYAVYPLEGLWDLKPEVYNQPSWTKDDLRYTLCIRQPDFITLAHLDWVVPALIKKNRVLDYSLLRLNTVHQGLCVQIMHTGPFADEPASFARMDAFCAENNLERIGKTHREIYLSDFTKTAPQNLKTILRIAVKKTLRIAQRFI